MNTDSRITNQESFLHAQELYTAKEYEKALSLFQAIPDKGTVIWYNMGNCAYWLGRYTDARIYWKKAERTASYAQRLDIQHNMRALNEKIGLIAYRSKGIVEPGLTSVQSSSFFSLQVVWLILWFLLFFYMRQWIRGRRYALILFFVVGNSMCGIAVVYKYIHRCRRVGIVTAEQTSLHAGPDTSYHTVGVVNSPAECIVKQIHGDWYKVSSGVVVGWINKELCELV